MRVDNGQPLSRRRFVALAPLFALWLAGCRKKSRAESRGSASNGSSRSRQSDFGRTDARRAAPRSRAAGGFSRRQGAESP
jgi:hypothetical protein